MSTKAKAKAQAQAQAQAQLTAQDIATLEQQAMQYAKAWLLGKEDTANAFAKLILSLAILALSQKGRSFAEIYDRLTSSMGKGEARKAFIEVAKQISRIERSFAFESSGADYSIICSSAWNEKEKAFAICLEPKEIYDRIADCKALLSARNVYLPRIRMDKLNLIKDDSKAKEKAEKAKAKKEAEAKAKAESEAKEKAQVESAKLLSPETVTSAEAVALIRRLINRLDNKQDVATILAVIQTAAKNI